MATKAKKRLHPMPKLGWKDQLIYWVAIILTGGFSLGSHFLVLVMQDNIAFSDPQVIARTVGRGNLFYFLLCLWCLIGFVLILLGPYQNRFPIFGRSNIKYGPPAYPRTYPLLMKNKPKHWISPKEAQKKKQARIIVAMVLGLTFLISVAVFPLSLYGRAVLHEDGTVVVYNARNREVHHYTTDEIVSVELEPYRSSGRYTSSWHLNFVITTDDSETYNFAAHSFAGTDLQQLQTMIHVKEELYDNQCLISGLKDVQKVIQSQYRQSDEKALVYQLFEMQK